MKQEDEKFAATYQLNKLWRTKYHRMQINKRPNP